MIRIERASAYATIQDSGRRGFLASGVPRAGAMDLPTLHTLNALLGNESTCAAMEWALSGGEIRFEAAATFAVGGAASALALSGRAIEPWRTTQAEPGDLLSIGAPENGRFLYIAVAGGIDAPKVMRSRSTYLPGEFGGVEGRRLRTGDELALGDQPRRRRYQVSDPLPAELQPPFEIGTVRYVPREDASLPAAWRISAASDRTGYRLDSDMKAAGDSITSEPVCAGVIQLPPGGEPIVLMADAPTIGGYRIAGAVISADLGALAQRLPGDAIKLERITVEAAQRELSRLYDRLASVRDWSLA